MDYQGFLRLAERGEIPPVLLLHGPDAQLLDDALDLLTRRLFPDGATAALGREVLDGRETTGEAVVNAALTLPLMTGLRLVVVRHAQAVPARHADALAAYARDPNPATRLVLMAGEGLRASRERRTEHWLLRAVPVAAVVDLPARHGRELAAWLRQRAAVEGLEVALSKRRTGITLECDDPSIPAGRGNLVYRACEVWKRARKHRGEE